MKEKKKTKLPDQKPAVKKVLKKRRCKKTLQMKNDPKRNPVDNAKKCKLENWRKNSKFVDYEIQEIQHRVRKARMIRLKMSQGQNKKVFKQKFNRATRE